MNAAAVGAARKSIRNLSGACERRTRRKNPSNETEGGGMFCGGAYTGGRSKRRPYERDCDRASGWVNGERMLVTSGEW